MLCGRLIPLLEASANMVPAAVRVRRYVTGTVAGQLVRRRHHAPRKG